CQGRPKIRMDSRQNAIESGGSNSHRGKVRAIKHECLSQDSSVRAQALLPKSVTEHHHGMRPESLIFLRQKRAPQYGLNTQNIEEIPRNERALRLLALPRPAPSDYQRVRMECEQAGKYLVVVAVVDVVRIVQRHVVFDP